MKTLEEWFELYGESHKNETNKAIHYICVPSIFFSIVGLMMSVPSNFLVSNFPFLPDFITNWAAVILIFLLVFYIRLSLKLAFQMLLFSLLCLALNQLISIYFNLALISISIFIIAWIVQFYGHKIEGKKPSFLNDVKFLLIGPAWVIDNLFSKN